jgi:septum formation protein
LQLILASASPRRAQLLQQLGVQFHCDPADIDETPRTDEAAQDYVLRMAQEKAAAVARRHDTDACVILGADTTVVLDEELLGKPRDRLDALGVLARLSGRTHDVMTGICLVAGAKQHSEVVTTQVEFVSLDHATCEAYLDTDEPWDKAGGYGIQGLGGAFVKSIRGSYSNVVGLPLAQAWALLHEVGVSGHLAAAAAKANRKS